MGILCAGEMVADIVVRPVPCIDFQTDSIVVDEISVQSGGDALNTAIGLARLGTAVTFVGRAGNDTFGEQLVEIAAKAGVDTAHMRYAEREESSKVIAMIRADGQRCFLHRPGANKEFRPDDVTPAAMSGHGHLHIGGTFHLPAFDGAGAAKLLRTARACGMTTSMDVAHDHEGRWLELIRPCLAHLTWFAPSESEAKHLFGAGDCARVAARCKALGVENVLIKLGADGVYCSSAQGPAFRCAAYDVPVVDTTGAGDGFMAGFLSALDEGLAPEACVLRGSANAAFVIQAVGAVTGVPDRTVLLEFIEQTIQPEIAYERE